MTKTEFLEYITDLAVKANAVITFEECNGDSCGKILILNKQNQNLSKAILNVQYFQSSFVVTSLYDTERFDIKHNIEPTKDKWGLNQLTKMKACLEKRIK